jgi:hypothetical protein
MFDMGFDIYAMVKPKTRADVIALLHEAQTEAENVSQMFTDVFAACEAARKEGVLPPKAEDSVTTTLIEFEGVQLSPVTWAEFLDVSFQYLHARMMKLGWSYERAIAAEMAKKRYKAEDDSDY